jgi:hypothetical protein
VRDKLNSMGIKPSVIKSGKSWSYYLNLNEFFYLPLFSV